MSNLGTKHAAFVAVNFALIAIVIVLYLAANNSLLVDDNLLQKVLASKNFGEKLSYQILVHVSP